MMERGLIQRPHQHLLSFTQIISLTSEAHIIQNMVGKQTVAVALAWLLVVLAFANTYATADRLHTFDPNVHPQGTFLLLVLSLCLFSLCLCMLRLERLLITFLFHTYEGCRCWLFTWQPLIHCVKVCCGDNCY